MNAKKVTLYNLKGKAIKVFPHEAEALKKAGKATDKSKRQKSEPDEKEEKAARATKEDKTPRKTKG